MCRSNRVDYATMAGRLSAGTNNKENTELYDTLQSVKQEEEEKDNEHFLSLFRMSRFQRDNCITYEDFRALGVEAAQPIADEYKCLFVSPGGEYQTSLGSVWIAFIAFIGFPKRRN